MIKKPSSQGYTHEEISSASMVVFELEILEPNENPVTDNNFTFDTSNPGKCNVTGLGTSHVSSLEDDLTWSITSIAGSSLSSNPSPPKGQIVTFTYTTLPSANGEFGEKILKLSLTINGEEYYDTQPVEIFFSRDGTNNPGGTAPNWYYYWSQTSASTGSHMYNPSLTYDGAYPLGKNYFEIGPSAKDVDGGLVIKGEGIDNFGSTCLHEKAHMDYWLSTWGNVDSSPLAEDRDRDGLKDSAEPTMRGLNGNPYDPTLKDTNSDGYDDFEDYAAKYEDTWAIGSHDSIDWANPGKQINK